MGAGAKTKHKAYMVEPEASPDASGSPYVNDPEMPFLAPSIMNLSDYVENEKFEWPTNAGQPLEWFKAGFGIGGVSAYTGNGITDPSEAATWYGWGFAPAQAGEWKGAGFDPVGAYAWSSVGFLPSEAKQHDAAGLTPLQAAALRLMQLMQLQHIRRPTMFLTAAYATYLDLLGNPSTGGPNDSGDDDIPDEPDEALVTSALCPICLTPSGYFQLPDSFVCSKCGFGSMSPLESEKPVPMPVPMMGKADESAGLSEEEMPTESLAASPVKDFPDIAPATTLADAGKVSEQAWNESVTPIPDEILAGDPAASHSFWAVRTWKEVRPPSCPTWIPGRVHPRGVILHRQRSSRTETPGGPGPD